MVEKGRIDSGSVLLREGWYACYVPLNLYDHIRSSHILCAMWRAEYEPLSLLNLL